MTDLARQEANPGLQPRPAAEPDAVVAPLQRGTHRPLHARRPLKRHFRLPGVPTGHAHIMPILSSTPPGAPIPRANTGQPPSVRIREPYPLPPNFSSRSPAVPCPATPRAHPAQNCRGNGKSKTVLRANMGVPESPELTRHPALRTRRNRSISRRFWQIQFRHRKGCQNQRCERLVSGSAQQTATRYPSDLYRSSFGTGQDFLR